MISDALMARFLTVQTENRFGLVAKGFQLKATTATIFSSDERVELMETHRYTSILIGSDETPEHTL